MTLDTARYHNRYFRIGHDSLILYTVEDLSLINKLKINVITVDCNADTFSQTFDLLFDTTVMKFNYPLPDTIQIQFESVLNGILDIRLSDQSGRIIYQEEGLKANQGNNHYQINIDKPEVGGFCFLNLNLNNSCYITRGVLIE